MKKRYLFLLTIALLAAGLLVTTQVYAQDPTPPDSDYPGFGPGRVGPIRKGAGDGLLHEYMTQAIADEFKISLEELEQIRSDGDMLWQSLDVDFEEFRSRMLDVRQAALEKAASDGVISEDQLDWMLDHTQDAAKGPFGPGDGSCRNGDVPDRPRLGRRGGRGRGGW